MECSGRGSTMRDDARVCLSCGEIVRAKVAPGDRLTAAPAGVPAWIAFDAPRQVEPFSYPASRLQRIFAVLIDTVVLGVAGLLVAALLGEQTATVSGTGGVSVHWSVLLPLLAMNAAYTIIFPATRWQGTPGKRLLGLRIVNLEHEPISLPQSIGRWACQQVIFGLVIPLAMMVALLGCIAVPIAILILCGDGRSPWDRMAGTMVVD